MSRFLERVSYYRTIRRLQGHVLSRRESLRRAWRDGPRKKFIDPPLPNPDPED